MKMQQMKTRDCRDRIPSRKAFQRTITKLRIKMNKKPIKHAVRVVVS